MSPSPLHQELAERLAGRFAAFPQVEAIALGGSSSTGHHDETSDIDLYVYAKETIPLSQRQALVGQAGGASRADLNLLYWDLGDEWFHRPTGIEVDVIYWPPQWIEEQLDRVLCQHQPSLGYTTCFWHTVHHSQILFDRNGWFQKLQTWARQEYPEPLRRAIVAHNHAVLRPIIPSYFHQVEKAVRRGDLVSVNHRLAALMASYFDILFAANRLLHPGEKRLAAFAESQCPSLPTGMAAEVEAVLRASAAPGMGLLPALTVLLDHLDEWLEQEGLL